MIVRFSKKADKDLSAIDKSEVKLILKKIKDFIAGKSLDVIRIKGHDDIFRLRAGNYRVLFEFIEDEIKILHVLRIQHRKDVYRDL
jgi:mRNA interferase RelE/StbE